MNKDQILVEEIIPKLACFRALLVIKNILDIKFKEKKTDDESEVKKEEEPEAVKEGSLSPSKKTEINEEEQRWKEEQELKKKEQAELDAYGRQWIWQGYISENRKENWLETAETLRHINDHVIQDMQDYIMIEAFGPKASRKVIAEKVETLLVDTEKAKVNTEDKDIGKEALKKRQFEMSLRPPYVWNFFETRADVEVKTKLQNEKDTYNKEQEKEEQEEIKVDEPYLINANAHPEECYKNEEFLNRNRVKKVFTELNSLTHNLKTHEEAKWKTLTKLCIEIFHK